MRRVLAQLSRLFASLLDRYVGAFAAGGDSLTALPLAPLVNGGAILPDQMTSKAVAPWVCFGVKEGFGLPCSESPGRWAVSSPRKVWLHFGGGGAREARVEVCCSRLSSLERFGGLG